jgi:hypothetical protein
MTKMKLLLSSLAVAAFAIVGSSLYATGGCFGVALPEPEHENKVTLCHFTSSETNPFVINEVAESALDNHVDHHGDCWRFFGGPTICVP